MAAALDGVFPGGFAFPPIESSRKPLFGRLTMNHRPILHLFRIVFLTTLSVASAQSPDGLRLSDPERARLHDQARSALLESAQSVPAAVLPELQARLIHAGRSGTSIVRFRRLVDGIDVYGQQAVVLIAKDGNVLAVRQNLGQASDTKSGLASGFRMATGRKYWWESDGKLIPAILAYRYINTKQGPAMLAELKSWPDGRVLKSASVTDHLAFDYRVYEGDDPFGHSQPHPTGIPDGFRPSVEDPPVLMHIDELSVVRDDPWLPPGATETLGNNVDAFFNSIREVDGSCDSSFDDSGGAWGASLVASEGDFRPQAVAGAFDFVYDESISAFDVFQSSFGACPAVSPMETQINAKIVQIFYWGNLLHNFFYDAGFDEVSGNAQQDNFGRGGIAGDRFVVQAGSQTTFMSTPGDGDSPVMVVGRNSRSSSNRDSSLDFSVFAHEWGHYMVRRLVGGGAAFLSTVQGGSLNEGWADFIGVLVNVRAADFSGAAPGATSSYAVGSYMNQDYSLPFMVATSTGLADSYFYGIRRWPYGASNPFTFRHIQHGEPLPAGFDFFDWKTRSLMNAELHTAGEIWAASLWDCARAIFVDRSDRFFAENRARIAEYLVAGMKLTPLDPTYTEARDALLLAMHASDQKDFKLCRASFAARGMGSGSLSPSRDSKGLRPVLESFANDDLSVNVVASSLVDDRRSIDHDGILDHGETGTLRITIKNTGFNRIKNLRVSPVRSREYELRPARQVRNLMPGDEKTLRFRTRIRHTRNYDPTQFIFKWRANSRGAHAVGRFRVTQRTQFDIRPWKGADNAEFAETFSDWRIDELIPARSMDPSWKRRDVGGNGVYAAGEKFARYDQALVSPPLSVTGEFDFRVGFDQAFQFQRTLSDGTVLNKGIARVDISNDDGASWINIATYSGNSTAFPGLAPEELNLGSTYAMQTVRLRFRLQSDTAMVFSAGTTTAFPVDEAWFLDNIQFFGISGEPLTRVFDEDGI